MTPLRAGIDKVFDHEFVRFLRREHPSHAHQLMGFLVPYRNRYCVGLWLNRDRGLVVEIDSFDLQEGPSRELVVKVDWWLHPERRLRSLREFARKANSEDEAQEFMESWAEERARNQHQIQQLLPRAQQDHPALVAVQ